mgnify:CR=1 FL=1|tara:strand:+ start:3933 stop:6263 length:2331 start_codon:yes stop_codon:yes gene_type:complete
MGTGYTRTNTADIQADEIVKSAPINAEFNAVLNAFAASTGHTHDGTAAEGGPITKLLGTSLTLGDGTAGTDITVTFDGETNDGVLIWMEDEDHFKFSDDVVIDSTKKLYLFDEGGEHISSDGTDLTFASGNDINLTATTDINIPANVGLTFGDDAEKIEGDGTDLTISGNNINLTAVADVVVPANVGITFGTGEKIEGDNTDLTITSGAKINLTATSDIHVPNNVGIVFGGDSEKIEGDGTDMTISANNLTVDAVADITLDAGDADIVLKDDGTQYGAFTNSSGNLIIKSGSTTMLTGSGANATFAGNVTVDGDLDVTGTFDLSDSNFTNAGDIQLDSISGDGDTDTAITFSGSNVITVSAGGSNQVTFTDGAIVPSSDNDIDLGTSSVEFKDAFFDGTVTTDALVADTANIDGGSIDGATLGTNSAITQAVIDSVNIDGATIGHTSDTDLITLSSGVVTVAGELDATSLDISGNADIDGTLEADAITVNGIALDEFIQDTVGAMVSSNTESGGIDVTYDDSDGTLDFTISSASIASAQTGIESIKNTSLVIGRDDDNLIKFGTDNQIIFEVSGGDNVIFKASGEIEATSLDISGDADIDGTLEADAITVDGTALSTVIAGTTVTNATNSAHVLVTDNESTDEDNLITFVENATSSTGNVGLEMDGNLTYNPSTGKLTATQLAGTLQTAAQTNVTSLGTLTGLTVSGKPVFDAGVSVKNGSTGAGFIEFFEDSDNGTNKVTLVGPSSTGDTTLTLPSATGTVATVDDATALAIALG